MQKKMRRSNIMKGALEMEDKYDFSKGEQGRFYRPDAVLKIPIYLDEDIFAFIEDYAKEKNSDIQTAVNEILRRNKEMLQALKS